MPNHRTSLVIIRAWVEDESAEPLRAHVRIIDDISLGVERTFTLARAQSVSRLVDDWLQGVLGATAAGSPR